MADIVHVEKRLLERVLSVLACSNHPTDHQLRAELKAIVDNQERPKCAMDNFGELCIICEDRGECRKRAELRSAALEKP